MEDFNGKKHVFNLTPDTNDGKSLTLTTTFHDNGDGEYYTSQELTLQSYQNSASPAVVLDGDRLLINLCGASLTPENLRKLATELESAYISVGIIKPTLLK